MKRFIKKIVVTVTMLFSVLGISAQNNDGFFKRAFKDMKESAKLQRKIDKANFQATKLENKAFFQEQKRLSKPSVRTAEERKRMEAELAEANKRLEEAQTKLENAKK